MGMGMEKAAYLVSVERVAQAVRDRGCRERRGGAGREGLALQAFARSEKQRRASRWWEPSCRSVPSAPG